MRKHRSDRVILAVALILMAIGLIVIYAIGPMRANFLNSVLGRQAYKEQGFFVHQLITVLASIVAMIIGFKFPYQVTRKAAKWVLLAGLVSCILLAILAFGHSSLASCQLGGCRWFRLGSFNFQPAELLKMGVIMYMAQLIRERKAEGKLEESSDFWVPYVVVGVLALLLVVVVQKDGGTGVVIAAILLAMLLESGVSFKKIGLVCAVVIALGIMAVLTSPHRMERLLTFGGKGDASKSYHIKNAMMAIGTGGLFGVGVGNSVQATGYLPESINDSVFAVMGETFGFLGLMAVMGCFAILLMRLLKIADATRDEEQKLVVVGVFAWMATHVLINVAAMTGLMPLSGITLPLLSYGGTSMVFISLALGVCLQLSCYTEREVKNESIDSRRRLGGTYNASRSRRA